MATDLTGENLPVTGWLSKRVALNATAADVEEVLLPAWCRQVTIALKQTDDATDDSGKVASTGTDGGAIGNDWFPIASGGTLTWPLRMTAAGTGPKIYITASTNTAFAHLILQPVPDGR